MDIINETRFPHLEFESRTPGDRKFHTLVLEGAFAITPEVKALHSPMVSLENEYRGEPGRSSMTWEAPLAPPKRGTDIHVNAVARAAQPLGGWGVRVRVGSVEKRLRVRGPHVWRHRDGAWRRTAPKPCREVAICYEHAFGGSDYEENPYGTGWIRDDTPTDREVRAPQVLAEDEPDHAAGQTYRPQGLGPIEPSWSPRLERAGTFDAAWEKERWPMLPEDFSYWFYSSASPGLIC